MIKKKIISVVVPVYNESFNVEELYERIISNFVSSVYDYEIIFVDNSSSDDTVDKINSIICQDNNVRCIIMSRNFGTAQPSIIAGIKEANGNAIITIDGDLQDPPEVIKEFIKKWEEGYQVVYGIRANRQGPIIMKIGYWAFSVLFRKLSYMDYPLFTGDYGLIDEIVASEIRKLRENDIVYRGIRAWVGFKQTGIEYTRYDRRRGVSSSSILKNFRWAARWIYNFSDKPLQWIANLATASTAIALLSIIYFIYSHFSRADIPTGTTTVVILIIVFSSIQLLSLSIIGTYIALIVREIKGRPNYIVRDVINKKRDNHI